MVGSGQSCPTSCMSSSIHLFFGNLYPEVRRHQDCPPGEHFDMSLRSLQIGRPVFLADFPEATDKELARQPEGQPMITTGNVSCLASGFELAAATYQGGRDTTIAV